MKPTTIALLIVFAACFDAPISAATIYNVTALAGNGSDAYGINSSGHVTGVYNNGTANHALYWTSNGGIIDLGTVNAGGDSVGRDISDTDNVVGQAGGFAFRWTPGGGFVQLDTHASDARGINSSNTIFGTETFGGAHSERWDSSNNKTALFASTSSQGYAIDNSGATVGRTTIGGGYYSDGSSNSSFTTNFGTTFLPDDINNIAQIAGVQSGLSELYDTSNSTFSLIGKLGSDISSEPFGINDLTQIVGESTASGGSTRGYIWDTTLGIRDLNTELASGFQDWTILSANDINNNGQIVGLGQLGGQQFAVLLTPVPEPSAAPLAALGVCGVIGAAIRRARLAATR